MESKEKKPMKAIYNTLGELETVLAEMFRIEDEIKELRFITIFHKNYILLL